MRVCLCMCVHACVSVSVCVLSGILLFVENNRYCACSRMHATHYVIRLAILHFICYYKLLSYYSYAVKSDFHIVNICHVYFCLLVKHFLVIFVCVLG